MLLEKSEGVTGEWGGGRKATGSSKIKQQNFSEDHMETSTQQELAFAQSKIHTHTRTFVCIYESTSFFLYVFFPCRLVLRRDLFGLEGASALARCFGFCFVSWQRRETTARTRDTTSLQGDEGRREGDEEETDKEVSFYISSLKVCQLTESRRGNERRRRKKKRRGGGKERIGMRGVLEKTKKE